MTLHEFIAFALLPENSERNFEFIDGEIIEKIPGSTYNSALALNIGFEVTLYCQQNNIPCRISTAYGAYRIGNNVVTPSLAYKPTSMSADWYRTSFDSIIGFMAITYATAGAANAA